MAKRILVPPHETPAGQSGTGGGAAGGGGAGRAAGGRGAPRRDPRRVRRPLRRPGGGDPARGGGLRRGPDRTHDEDGEQPHAGGAGQRGRAGVPEGGGPGAAVPRGPRERGVSAALSARLAALARITRAPSPVVSVYLGTRWADEHQRERVRVFLANEIKKARALPGSALGEDLDWIAAQGEALVQQTLFPGATGVVLFACGPLGLREALPVRAAVEDTFVVNDAPYLRRLAEIVRETPSALVVFVDGESARLIQVGTDGVGAEVTLESDVPNRHRQGGWRLLAQTRFQRHIEEHRGRHFDAVAATLADVADEHGVDHIVLAGEAPPPGALPPQPPGRSGPAGA